MKQLFKKYWDLISGFATSILISVIAKFDLGKIQLVYTILILTLVCIGVFKIIKQTTKKEQRKGLIDKMVDSQKPIKATQMAEDPTKEGEELGHLLLDIKKRITMKGFKLFIKKYGFYILSGTLLVYGVLEYFFGFTNNLFGGKVAIKGLNLIPIILLIAANVLGSLATPVKRVKKVKKNPAVLEALKNALKETKEQLKLATKVYEKKKVECKELKESREKAGKELTNAREVYSLNLGLVNTETLNTLFAKVDNLSIQIDEKVKDLNDAFETKEKLVEKVNTLKKQIKEA